MKREFIADHFLVAFIDVLGQSNQILENSVYPPTKLDLEKINQNILDTSEYIISLRTSLKNHFKKYRKLKDVLEGLPKKQKRMEQRLGTINAEFLGVSDSIIISVPLENKTDNYIPIHNIKATFEGICFIYNIALSKHKPIRGGIDIGWGTKLAQNEVYGSSLVKAYRLESEEAKYPRVVVGESLWEYINYVENFKTNTQYGIRANKVAKQCKDLVVKYHKKYILDVIGQSVKSSRLSIDSELVKSCYDCIVKSQMKYKREGDNKLASRYQLLRNYYESRLKLWGIKRKKL